ncbi:MAG: hypothetical protein FGM15_09890 [Chthoniobacterales bacterium]|nr:hypothetical protein [Chthoniobacterales bacterium]
MKPQEIIKRWAKATDPKIRVSRLNQDHTIDSRYPDVVPTVHISLELDADENGHKPLLRAWIPLGRRTPLFAFAKNSAHPEQADIDATFPSFEDADSLVGALDKVHGDFLKRYGRQTKTQKGRL